MKNCAICEGYGTPWQLIEGYQYFRCQACDSIYIDPEWLGHIDGGKALRTYDETYWRSELRSSRERSFGSSIARVAESILFARRPIEKYLDIGSGPGYLLDALSFFYSQLVRRSFLVLSDIHLRHTLIIKTSSLEKSVIWVACSMLAAALR